MLERISNYISMCLPAPLGPFLSSVVMFLPTLLLSLAQGARKKVEEDEPRGAKGD